MAGFLFFCFSFLLLLLPLRSPLPGQNYGNSLYAGSTSVLQFECWKHGRPTMKLTTILSRSVKLLHKLMCCFPLPSWLHSAAEGQSVCNLVNFKLKYVSTVTFCLASNLLVAWRLSDFTLVCISKYTFFFKFLVSVCYFSSSFCYAAAEMQIYFAGFGARTSSFFFFFQRNLLIEGKCWDMFFRGRSPMLSESRYDYDTL